MNEKLTIQDLTDLLASKHSMTKKDAEAFVKEFFLLIEETLENEKYLKIKGLGTFKLIEVDNRESVNVNTGERFQIKGHTKVSFTPDTNLRDIINKPFAHFETVVLNDNTVLEDTQEDDVDGEEDEVVEEASVRTAEIVEEVMTESETVKEVIPEAPIPIQEVAIVEELKPVIEEKVNVQNETVQDVVEPVSVVEEPVLVAEEPVEEIEIPIFEEQQSVSLERLDEIISTSEEVVTIEKVEEQVVTSVIEQQKQAELVTGPINSRIEFTAEQIIAQELQKAKLKPEVFKNQQETQISVTVANNDTVVAATERENASKKEKSPIPYLITIIILVLLLCASAIVFIYYPDLFSSSPPKNTLDMPVSTRPVQLTDTIAKNDTVVKSAPVANQETPVVKNEIAAPVVSAKKSDREQQPQTSNSVYSDSAVYTITGTKGIHTISVGESLTKVSLHYYGTKALWPYIVKHNQGVIKNPDNVPYGTTIKIPELTKK